MSDYKVKTILHDEEYLRQVSKDVEKGDPDLEHDIEIITNYCKEGNKVLAFAAVQIGIPKKIIYIKNTNVDDLTNSDIDDEIVMINPMIISEEGEAIFWEACASCLDKFGRVKRPYKIKVKYLDADFNEKEETLEGFKATVFSHEYDHLYGILHIDIADIIYDMSWEERKEFRKKEGNGYTIISKTGKYKHPLR